MPGEEISLFKTYNTSTWMVEGFNFKIGPHDMSTGPTALQIDPEVPYLYLPQKDFVEMYGFLSRYNPYMSCSERRNYCKFHAACPTDESGDELLVNSDMQFSIRDVNGIEKVFNMKLSDLLLKGSRFKLSDSSNCFLPIFRLPSNLNQNKWLLGTMFLNEYYTAYDMTPYDEEEKDYIQVGIGPINPNGLKQEEQPKPPPPPPENKTEPE